MTPRVTEFQEMVERKVLEDPYVVRCYVAVRDSRLGLEEWHIDGFHPDQEEALRESCIDAYRRGRVVELALAYPLCVAPGCDPRGAAVVPAWVFYYENGTGSWSVYCREIAGDGGEEDLQPSRPVYGAEILNLGLFRRRADSRAAMEGRFLEN